MKYIFLLLPFVAIAQTQSLEVYTKKLNTDLPEVYDKVTKLMRATSENNNLTYHFIVNANQGEFDWAMPKVKEQVLKTICKSSREKFALTQLKANLVYSYENVKGQSLGQFMVKPEHCPSRP